MPFTSIFINRLSIALLLLFSISCETYIDIDVPPLEKKPVLNCLFTENQAFKLRLSLSADVKDTSETLIEGATVRLYANGDLVEQLADLGNGVYVSDYKAQLATKYRIEADVEGFETIRATDSLPQMVLPENVYYKKNAIAGGYGNTYTEANITINDPGFTDNYYEISLSAKHTSSWYDPDYGGYHTSYTNDNIAYWLIDDPVINAEDVIGWVGSIAFSDMMFNGEKYQLKLPVDDMPENATHYVRFNTVSGCYYKYKSTMDKHLFNQGGWSYDDLLLIDGGNPVEMYTNVENGYGIFAGYMSQLIEVTDIRE